MWPFLQFQYDEIVPLNLTTHHGGFYINSGSLDFRLCSISGDDVEPDPTVVQKPRKKKKLSTESSDKQEAAKKQVRTDHPAHAPARPVFNYFLSNLCRSF